ncbi:MAG: Ubiquinone biosynthesis monooxygenase UbiB [Micavibrio sp.]|nr:Ubiquinone biosynthesis monooxygenase UbiB [Micavibrio sp.]
MTKKPPSEHDAPAATGKTKATKADKPLGETSTAGGRIARYAKVSGAMAGLATRMAGERYLGMKIEREKHAADLLTALGGLKGPLMKVGQILSTIPEALPPEYARALQQLQSNAPPMGWPFVRRRMKTELGPDWETKFKSFEKESSAAASLGQVHKAVTHDGQLIACKLQYPDMSSAIEADLNQLKLIFSLYEKYDKAISTKYIHKELALRLNEELDYELEARHAKLYRWMLRDEKDIHVPEIVNGLSTKRLLCSTWLEGDKILNYVDAPQETRDRLAYTMFRAWYVPLYYYGVIHGDPHLGNYSVRQDLGINLLDFGCVRVFPPAFIGGVIDLYHALMEDDNARAVHAYETWGFKNLSNDKIETLNIWARFLYGPLMEDRIRPIGEVTEGVYGRETAQKVHERLRENGGVTVPSEFVFMDRAALGLGSVFLHLKAQINWHRLFNEMIDGFNVTDLAKRQDDALKKFSIIPRT